MGFEPGSTSQDGRDEDDEDEYEEVGEGNRLLGFMFGNVDGAGDLDIDYLDEEAKEHLGALADKLGSSLTDINLSVKSVQTSVDAAEQDYDEKAEDAVDYEDIEEQYEGPETQAVTEEDYLLPKKDYLSTDLSTAGRGSTSVFDDDNYDEDEDDEEFEKEIEAVDNNSEIQTTNLSGELGDVVLSQGENSVEDDLINGTLETEDLTPDLEDFQKEEPNILVEPFDVRSSTPLPILCIEDGKVILRFSEIFGIHESLKKAEKRDRRYSVSKDRYTSMDTKDVVEDDEEAFLRGISKGLSCESLRHANDDILDLKDNESEPSTLNLVQVPGTVASEVDEKQKDSCHSDEPMKVDVSVDPSVEWESSLSPELYPLEQQDWEDRIIWNNSPEMSDSAAESCEISGPDSDALINKKESETEQHNFHPELQIETNEKDHGIFLRSCPISVEPFGSRNSSGQSVISSERIYHPQLLRLESQVDLDNQNHSDGRKDGATEVVSQRDAIRRFSKITLQNKDLVEGSWLDKIVWEPYQSIAKPKLILDLQDEQMLFEVLDNKDGKHLQLHAGAMIINCSAKSSSGDSFELHGHGGLPGVRFNIANDKFYSNRKSSQQLKSHSKKRTAHGVKVLHSIPALKLQTMKAKLSK